MNKTREVSLHLIERVAIYQIYLALQMLACQVKIYQLAPNTELNPNFVLCSMPEDHTIK